jgi:ATP synthase protein I
MNDLFASALRAALFALSACLLAWAFVPAVRPASAGLALGVLASIWNSILLRRKVELLSQLAAEGKKPRGGVGFVARAAVVLLVCMVALRFPEHVSLIFVVVGSFFMPFASLMAGLLRKRS